MSEGAPGGRYAPDLYLVTDRNATAGRDVRDVVRAALQGLAASRARGGRQPRVAVQLREKDMAGRALLSLALDLRGLTRAAGAALFVNDRVDVALGCEADGVHLGGGSLAVAEVRAIAPRLEIGVSTHSLAEVTAAKNAGASFVVFGPVFDTPSKRGMGTPLGLAALAAGQGLPIIAIGGVVPANAAACLAAGAAGVACIRAVMAASDPRGAVAMFLECWPGHFAS